VPSEHSHRGAKRARQAREDLALGTGPLPDVLAAIESCGAAHVLVLDLDLGVAGAFIDRPGLPLLVVNGAQALSRQRFTLAHELGHLRMHHGSIVDRPEAVSGYDHDPVEVSANAFAAELLMPKVAVRAWSRTAVHGQLTLVDVVTFAAAFGVSAQAARYAFATAAVETDEGCLQALDAAIAEGAHIELWEERGLRGPDDAQAHAADRLPRIPEPLRDSALGDLLAGAIGAEDLAVRIRRSATEVTAMLDELGIADLLPAA